MNTDRLIDNLAQDLRPAPALRGPWVRAAWWLMAALAYLLGILVLMMASGADVAANAVTWRFVLPQVAAMVTAAASAAAAFASTVPGSSRRLLVLPAVTTTVWIGSLVGGAVQEWTQGNGASLRAPGEWWCVAMILIGGALPGLGLLLMLRHGAPLTPRLTAALGVLAAAALVNVSACVLHPHQSHAVTLVWHGSTILVAVVLAALGSRLVLTWEKRRQLAASGASGA